ncbi:hypothetical protein [Arcicella rosea]|uniref:Novel STAND NTPase 1 domain-containing protein n=1 Tax=Arcicella rosea TaxID=502909 RepID=A0A841EN51_9BACT|nr:hypothetical protein [Arcicella rosea]MBB6002158.1 hypothetical protein [Arcicella rosea]
MNEEQAIEVYRYPGVTPFSTEHKELLMGREKDIEAFYQLLTLKQLIILYGKSGYGKSSLINAGVIPKLVEAETNKSVYFNIRLYAKNKEKKEPSPIEKLLEKLKENVLEQSFLHHAKINITDEFQLWYWLKNHQYASNDAAIILFFDQFEELFSYDKKEEIIPFAELLGKMLFQDLPHDFLEDAYQELWKAKEKETNPERLQALDNDISLLYKKPNIKLVFSLRSDRLSLLNQLTDYLPNLQQNYYELNPISENAARLAITQPAQIINEKFTTPEFVFEKEVVETIIKRVKNTHDGKIDTATLQIICRFIEEQKVWKEKKLSITGDVLGDITNIFKNFYQTSLSKLNKEEKAIASQTIEEKFIQNNQRIPFAGDHLKQEYHLSQTVLDELEKSTLLRKERDTAGRFIYEIGHDTLIEPIYEFAEQRKIAQQLKIQELEKKQLAIEIQNKHKELEYQRLQEEISKRQAIQIRQELEAQKLQQELDKQKQKEQELKNQKLQQELDSRKKITKIYLSVGVLFLFLIVWIYNLWRTTESEKEKVEQAKENAQKTLYQLYYQQAKTVKDNGDNILRNKDVETARYYYDSANVILEKIPETDSIATELKSELQKLLKK